jgi:hypothetical protein
VPTAIQVVSFGHVIAERRVPEGIEDEFVGVQLLKFTVLRLVPPPPLAMPTTSHTNDPAHETDVNTFTDGWSRTVQVDPFWVPMMDGRELITPTAAQVRESGQDTPAKVLSPPGEV